MTKILIRVDSSFEIGTGHVMRCLVLADRLRSTGARVDFVSRDHLGNISFLVEERGFRVLRLPSPSESEIVDGPLGHSRWLGVPQHRDALETIKISQESGPYEWIVVDHYALDFNWESMLRQTGRRIFAIDDLADRMHDCDLLLDQNLYSDMSTRYAGKVSAGCTQLLGPSYALLKPEFQSKRVERPRARDVKRILVFFGGIDARNYTEQAIEALAGLPQKQQLHVDVVIGAHHLQREQLALACSRHGFVCHIQTTRMAELMAEADLAIGAGGIATWERCCLGLPSLVIATAENQERQLRDAALAGLVCLSDADGDSASISIHVKALLQNSALRDLMSKRGMEMVDGRGAMRVCGHIEKKRVQLRAATMDDAKNLYDWRNHISVRSVSHHDGIIEWSDHIRWLRSVCESSDKILLIGTCEGAPIGVVRYEVQEEEAAVSIYLVPDTQRGSGFGTALLDSAEEWLRRERPQVRQIVARILAANQRSMRLFVGAGFKHEYSHYAKRLVAQND